jgi:NTE family protein
MKKLAWVLSGGASRGALQVGAVRALLEAGIQPDLLVGTSIGAVNASYLAIHGATLETIDGLENAWADAMRTDLLPANYLTLALRTLLNLPINTIYSRNRDFYISHGLPPDYRFRDIQGVELVLVATDLNAGGPILYGKHPDQLVLDGLLASIALPPWMSPKEQDGQLLIDGGVVSNLPIEPALSCGASEIIALDLLDTREVPSAVSGIGDLLNKVIFTVSKRQIMMELALADSLHVPIRRVNLMAAEPIALWDFQHTPALIEQGYKITQQEIARWGEERKSFWRRLVDLVSGLSIFIMSVVHYI